ncbi:putative serine/threonine protein kinase [Gregarina niphandrodes]|uniref:Serine/threonine protein kinase n=1 Tax=Gregarina niphandrodes TaxID=110365 RepID=A0A023B2V5_GRENI|nr:putative serine/threonine protein kinase [Gregarina niphandrodes]EZG55161.1 putative serine/threonine protein kinase [Gregarina niphandrodes]|eukprot:XP_011131749.1 putative serine/threonine protein kinase [Gregarina niphandrodes]
MPDEFDMFAASSDEEEEIAPRKRPLDGVEEPLAKNLRAADGYQDNEGYYVASVGEIIGERYKVLSGLCGKGVFSSVLRGQNISTGEMVAIKCIRKSDFTRDAGMKEIEKLKQLHSRDPLGNRPIVRYFGHFDNEGHLCIVCECLKEDLRSHIKGCGRGGGLDLDVVLGYSRQLVEGLLFLKECGIVHGDIKPDNILVGGLSSDANDDVSVDHGTIKLCDLGSAKFESELDASDEMVPRYYRAPEIYLGCKYSYPIDMWATMCTIYELCTGRFLFNGPSPSHMLLDLMKLKGKIPNKMLKNGLHTKLYFNENLQSLKLLKDTGCPVKPSVNIYDLLNTHNKSLQGNFSTP